MLYADKTIAEVRGYVGKIRDALTAVHAAAVIIEGELVSGTDEHALCSKLNDIVDACEWRFAADGTENHVDALAYTLRNTPDDKHELVEGAIERLREIARNDELADDDRQYAGDVLKTHGVEFTASDDEPREGESTGQHTGRIMAEATVTAVNASKSAAMALDRYKR